MVEAGDVKLLFDPGVLKYEKRFFIPWNQSDAVFVTHKHADHCDSELISQFKTSIPVYTTDEVIAAHPALDRAQRIQEGDEVTVGGVSIKAVKAIHGYHPRMRGNEVYQNIGFLVDDGKRRLYITSDTVCFPTDIKTDIIAIPVTGYGVTMTAFEASLFAKETGAKHVLLTHMDNEAFEIDWPYIDKHFKNAELDFIVLPIRETLDIE